MQHIGLALGVFLKVMMNPVEHWVSASFSFT